MKLQIRYTQQAHTAVSAAFIRGADSLSWLKEIDSWEISASDLECYWLPVSIQSQQVSGLFVVFKDPSKAKHIELADPYTCIDHRLFIPCHAELNPQVSRSELKNILLWDKQVFHPSAGLVGFEPKNRIDLSDLISFSEPLTTDWTFAHPGMPDKPAFREIEIVSPTKQELMNAIKESIQQKPLGDIPKGKGEASVLEKIGDKIKFGLLGVLYMLIQAMGKLMPKGAGGGVNPSSRDIGSGEGSSGRKGIFKKIEEWLVRNLEELERRRNSEINRLLNLFDKDSNEALEYAIPLDSPYKNRGTQAYSDTLTRNPLRFNLGTLGGGRVVDGWNIGGDHYYNLRTKYLAAAQKEIEKGDFKKAAYVYAHLLGDYHSAANVLEQGSMHREAAVLYKEHLKNPTAAADCLERGGLYLESIELNKELKRDEKVGDLYKQVNQQQNAFIYYEKHIETKLSQSDHLDAARVIDEKLEQRDRAQQVLLEGWGHSYQHENCLKKYFDIVLDTEPGMAVEKLKTVYTKSTPRHKRMPLLGVLEYLNQKKQDEAFTNTTQDIVYEIVNSEAENGNPQAVHNLKTFLPGDKLLGADTSRYAASSRTKQIRTASGHLQLDQSIRWMKATWHRNQFLVIGVKDQYLHMARGNWYGNFEYFSWPNPVKSHARFTFINAPYYSNHVIIHSSDSDTPVSRKSLPKNKYFEDELVVACPPLLNKGTAQFVITGKQQISRLEVDQNKMTLHHCTLEGRLIRSVNCRFTSESISLSHVYSNPLMAMHEGFYYTYVEKFFIAITEDGKAKTFSFGTLIRFFAASMAFTDFRIVVSTNKGCLLYKPSGGELGPATEFFAEKLIPSLITFLQADRFVIAEKTMAYLFEIQNNDVPVMVREYGAHSTIIAVLPVSKRQQFAIVEQSGKITICEIEE